MKNHIREPDEDTTVRGNENKIWINQHLLAYVRSLFVATPCCVLCFQRRLYSMRLNMHCACTAVFNRKNRIGQHTCVHARILNSRTQVDKNTTSRHVRPHAINFFYPGCTLPAERCTQKGRPRESSVAVGTTWIKALSLSLPLDSGTVCMVVVNKILVGP